MRLIGNVEKDAQVRAVASGALPSGDTVIVNSDGTVSVVGGSSASQTLGSAVDFETGTTEFTQIAYDAANDKVVITFQEGGRGQAIVGTVSGTSISFGTPVIWDSGSQTQVIAPISYDAASEKLLIAYRNPNAAGGGYARVGTVSGTSISFGTAAAFESASVYPNASVYDSGSGKVIITYRKATDSYRGYAVTATISGTSVSFGTPVKFSSGNSGIYTSMAYDATSNKTVIVWTDSDYLTQLRYRVATVSGTSISYGTVGNVHTFSASPTHSAVTFDDVNNKFVAAFRDLDNSNYGSVCLGTISGTDMVWDATPTVFNSGNSEYMKMTFDSNAGKVVIFFRDGSDGDASKLVVGEVSGSAISFGSLVEVGTRAFETSLAFDSTSNVVVIAYRDLDDGNDGTSNVFQNAYTSTNLTAENFLGFAAHTYADTQSALVNSTCTVDRNQTSLTAGQTYYVQTDGSLGTTAADPSVVAGTAISSTEIIVKG
jgi:hypothetical protein